jgi:hypothetical protein
VEIVHEGLPVDSRLGRDIVDRVIPVVGQPRDQVQNPAELFGGGLHHGAAS